VSGIVISYRRDDTEGSAGRLYDRLIGRYGEDFVFMDFNSIAPGDDWLRTIDTTVAGGNILVALIGPRWSSAADDAGNRRLDNEGDYVRREIRVAAEANVRLLPVLVQGAQMVGAGSLPADIGALSAVQPVELDSRYYDRDVEGLYRVIDGILGFGDQVPRWDEQRTAVAAFVGLAGKGSTNEPTLVAKWSHFGMHFGDHAPGRYLSHAVEGWFANGGAECWVVRVDADGGSLQDGTAFQPLERIDGVTMVAAPDIVGFNERGVFDAYAVIAAQAGMIAHCERRLDRLAILDPLPGMSAKDAYEFATETAQWSTMYAAQYYPWVKVEGLQFVPPSGHVAGSWARNDAERATWIAPANLPLAGVLDLEVELAHEEVDLLGRFGFNSLRSLPGQGIRVWGSKTLSTEPRFDSIPAARTVCALGTFLTGATSWAAFEPSNVRTWNRLKTSVEILLDPLWQRGAFVGETAADAYFVRSDEEVNPAEVAERGISRVELGLALTAPRDFIRMSVEQPSRNVALFLD
jgi:hypothetical protein